VASKEFSRLQGNRFFIAHALSLKQVWLRDAWD
jgi:hypothetical protein